MKRNVFDVSASLGAGLGFWHSRRALDNEEIAVHAGAEKVLVDA
jgi:hypothetical protein